MVCFVLYNVNNLYKVIKIDDERQRLSLSDENKFDLDGLSQVGDLTTWRTLWRKHISPVVNRSLYHYRTKFYNATAFFTGAQRLRTIPEPPHLARS